MIQKIALLIGGLGAAAVLAFALGLVNFAFADPTSNAVPEAQAAPADVAAAPAADSQNAQTQTNTQTKTVYDKVYIAPTPPPKTIHVTKPANTQPTHSNTPPAPATNTNTHSADTAEPGENEHDRGDTGERGDRGERNGGHERGDD